MIQFDIRDSRAGSPNLGEPLSKKHYGSVADTIDTWCSFPVYKTFTPIPDFSLPRGGQGDRNVFRLSETYLLRAEAHFWRGDLAAAADDINVV